MANSTTPFGLKIDTSNGKMPDMNYYYIPSNGAALFMGDPIIKTGTSNSTSKIDGKLVYPGTMPSISKAAAGDGNKITGIIAGFQPSSSDFFTKYNKANNERIAMVFDDPMQEYIIQDDGVVALDETVVGLNANLIYTNTGNISLGTSGAQLNSSTVATTATFQLKILRLFASPNNALGTNAQWVVRINNQTDANIVAGI
ncbi:MAG: hypothetical protein ULS35scaffold63_17 [Phage 33_17]|nr:MAG: hypothetical protein ULS35scaffold63_17 [Phage 33_17]